MPEILTDDPDFTRPSGRIRRELRGGTTIRLTGAHKGPEDDEDTDAEEET